MKIADKTPGLHVDHPQGLIMHYFKKAHDVPLALVRPVALHLKSDT